MSRKHHIWLSSRIVSGTPIEAIKREDTRADVLGKLS